MTRALTRRGALGALGALSATATAALVGACGSSPPPTRPAPAAGPPEKRLATLTEVLPVAGLRWLVHAEPREVAQVAWLIPHVARVVPESNLDAFAKASALDLRQLTEAYVASYELPGEGDTTQPEARVYIVRHAADARAVERAFVARLVTGIERSVDGEGVVRVTGRVGTEVASAVFFGPDAVLFQHGGAAKGGAAHIAALFATNRLKRATRVFTTDPLVSLRARFGAAPVTAYALGPFEGELARGARGVLEATTAIGAAARPSAREGIGLAIALAGDFSTSGGPASEALLHAWEDLATSSFGRLLGLDRPVEKPLVTRAPDAIALAVELSPDRVSRGLASATSAQIADIMR